MSYQTDKEIIEELAKKAELTEEDKKNVEDIYLRIMKEPVKDCNCSNKWSDAVVKLSLWFKHHDGYIVCNYTVARGAVFLLDGVAYSCMNMTDDIAERLLEENPTASKYITKNPVKASAPKKAATKKK